MRKTYHFEVFLKWNISFYNMNGDLKIPSHSIWVQILLNWTPKYPTKLNIKKNVSTKFKNKLK